MKNRVVEYDIVRFVAITLVFTLHFTSSAIRNSALNFDLDDSYIKYFGFGVKLFFTLSALLMAHKLDLADARPNYFLSRRIKRILPTHSLVFVFLFVVTLIFSIPVEIKRFISGVFLIDQLFYTEFNAINPVIWSLEVEIQFYFLIYILLLLKAHFEVNLRPGNTGVIMFIVFLLFSDASEHRTLVSYSVYFAFGLLLYEAEKKYDANKSAKFDALFMSSIVAVPVILDSELNIIAKEIMSALLTSIIIYSSTRLNILRVFLERRFIINIGLSSYSFYLLHFAIIEGYFRLLAPVLQWPILADYILIFASVFVSSFVCYKYVEINKALQ